MSGPKCVELDPNALALERERNRVRCELSLSEYRHLLNVWHGIGPRIEELGIAIAGPEGCDDDVETATRQLLANDRGALAASQIESIIARWRAALTDAQARIESRIADLQRRFRTAEARRAALLQSRGQFERAARASASVAMRAHVEDLIAQTLSQSVVPPPVEPGLHREAIVVLEDTERQLTAAEVALSDGGAAICGALEQSHGAALTAALTHSSAESMTIHDWLSTNTTPHDAQSAEESAGVKLDTLIARIAALADSDVWGKLLAQAEQVRSEPDATRRRLDFENLALTCSHELNVRRERRCRREQAARLIDIAAPWASPDVDTIAAQLVAIRDSQDPGPLDVIETRLNEAIVREQRNRLASARRRSVIESLRELGYEPIEGLETAIVRDGRLVFQRDRDEDYAVEIVANEDASLVQTNLVRFADEPDTDQQQRLRDRDREEAWCSDHTSLREKLAARGWSARLKVAIPPGERIVRVIASAGRRRRAAAQTESRRLQK